VIPFLKPILPSTERLIPYLKKIEENGYYSNNGQFVQQFEKDLQTYLQTDRDIVVVNNGTMGLALALKALGVESGKYVMIPSFTFAATASVCRFPDYVDIEPDCWCMDPLQVKDCGAIIPVDALGNPCDKEKFEAFGNHYEVPVIFDSASSIGATYNGKRVGNFGDIEVFSLHATKCLPVGEGGFLSIRDPEVAHRVRMLKNFGFDNDRVAHIEGTNAKMPEILAAIGIEALKDLPQHMANRQRYVKMYMERLDKLVFQKVRPGCQHGYQILSVLVRDAEGVVEEMRQRGIQVRRYYSPPLHQQPAYRSRQYLPITEGIANAVINLPLYSIMEEATIDFVCKNLKEVLCVLPS